MIPPPLILLPGLDGTGDLFRPLLGVLPPGVRARVISYPADQALPYDALLRLIGERLAGEPEVVLVAESFSGPLALRYAAAHAGRVRAVVLCASFVRSPLPRWLGAGVRPVLFRVPPPAFVVRRLMVGPAAPDRLVRAVRDAVGRVRPHVLAGRLRDVFGVDCADALGRCPAPVLYLAAAGDALVGRASVAFIRAARPDVRVRTLAGPHLLLQAEPRAAWLEVERFLTTVGEGGGRV